MTCPNCAAALPEPLTLVGTLSACPSCHRTLVVRLAGVRLAVDADVAGLTPVERGQVQKLRQMPPRRTP